MRKALHRTGLFSLLAVGLALPANAQSWPQTYFDAAHTGYNAKETTLSAANVSGLQLEWGSSVLTGGVAGFALDGGVIYAESFATSENLAAINASTGATLWTATAGSLTFSSNDPVATGGQLVFANCSFLDSGDASYGAICAYKESSGKLVWQWSNPCNCLPEGSLASPLVYDKGVVYFGYANGGAGGEEYFVAADAKTGATLWTYETGTSNTAGFAAVAVANGLVYVACASNTSGFKGVCALDQSSGALVWTADIGSDSLGFTAGKDLLYVNAGYVYEVFAFDAATGTPVWTFTTDGTNYPVAFAKDVVYALGSNHELSALNAKTGAEIWATASQNLDSSASVANGVIYVGQSGNGWPAASALDATDGSFLWSSPSSGYGSVPPIVANGTLYFADGPCGSVCAYDLPDGKSYK